MDKTILDIIGNFAAWRGDTYRLAMLIVEAQKEVDKAALIAAGFTEAAEIL
jgi:hypothetical protein